MATNVCTFSGRVMSVKPGEYNDKVNLQVTMAVNSRRKKKEGEAYPPSFLVQFTLWEKHATALQEYIYEGKKIVVTGNMGVPNTYLSGQNKDEPKAVLQLDNPDLELIGDSASSSTETSNQETKTTKKKKEQFVEEYDDIPF